MYLHRCALVCYVILIVVVVVVDGQWRDAPSLQHASLHRMQRGNPSILPPFSFPSLPFLLPSPFPSSPLLRCRVPSHSLTSPTRAPGRWLTSSLKTSGGGLETSILRKGLLCLTLCSHTRSHTNTHARRTGGLCAVACPSLVYSDEVIANMNLEQVICLCISFPCLVAMSTLLSPFPFVFCFVSVSSCSLDVHTHTQPSPGACALVVVATPGWCTCWPF